MHYPEPYSKRSSKMMEVSQDLRHLQMRYLYPQRVATLGHVSGQPLSDFWQKNPAMVLCKTKAGLAQYSNSDGAQCADTKYITKYIISN